MFKFFFSGVLFFSTFFFIVFAVVKRALKPNEEGQKEKDYFILFMNVAIGLGFILQLVILFQYFAINTAKFIINNI